MANNTYFQYLSLIQLTKKYEEVFQMLEDSEGEFTEEIEIKLKEAEGDSQTLGYEVLQIIDALVSEKKTNQARIDNLTKKNKSIDNQTKYLNDFLKTLVNKIGVLNSSANKNVKLGEISLTVSKAIGYEVKENFKDDRFIRYTFNNKINSEQAERIKKFLSDRNVEPEVEKVILKKELNAFVKENGLIEGVEEVPKENLIKK